MQWGMNDSEERTEEESTPNVREILLLLRKDQNDRL